MGMGNGRLSDDSIFSDPDRSRPAIPALRHPMRSCHWCGVAFDPGDQPARKTCKPTHGKALRRRRSILLDQPIKVCPTPNKRPYGYRGLAIVDAWRRGLAFYECVCGTFHLTARMEGNSFDYRTPLNYYRDHLPVVTANPEERDTHGS